MMQQHNLFSNNDNINTNNSNNTTLVDVAVASAIVTENTLLRTTIRQLEEENQRLKVSVEQQDAQKVPQRETAAAAATTVVAVSATEIGATADGPSPPPLPRRPSRIILETFEGERRIAEFNDEVDDEECVLVYDEDTDTMADSCPIEPNIGFGEALRDRATWLVGLLILQSLSGIILSHNELLLANHPVIIYYLTMMVGAGGNAGNQASVRGTFHLSIYTYIYRQKQCIQCRISGFIVVSCFVLFLLPHI